MNVGGTSSTGSVDSDVELNFKDDLLDKLAGAYMFHYEAKEKKPTLSGDYMFSDLDPKTELPCVAEIDNDLEKISA